MLDKRHECLVGLCANDPIATGGKGRYACYAAIDRLLGYVREAVRASLGADPGDEDESMTELISVGAWSLVHGLVQLINDRQITPGAGALPTESALVDGVIDIYIRGLEARAKASANA